MCRPPFPPARRGCQLPAGAEVEIEAIAALVD
jgi:hypothetical protein